MNGNDYNNSSSSGNSNAVTITQSMKNWIVHSLIFLHELKLYSRFSFRSSSLLLSLSVPCRRSVRLFACINICSQMIRRINTPFAYKIQWIFTVNFDQLIGKWKKASERERKEGREVILSHHYTRISFVRSFVRFRCSTACNQHGTLSNGDFEGMALSCPNRRIYLVCTFFGV